MKAPKRRAGASRIARLRNRIERLRAIAKLADTPLSKEINKLAEEMGILLEQVKREHDEPK